MSHPPIGSLCSLPSIPLTTEVLIQQEKSPQKKRSCPPSQHRSLRPLSTYLGHSTLATKALYSHKLRDRHIYTSQTHQTIPGTYNAVYSSCVWRLWVVFLEHGGGVLGIFKSPVCALTYNQAWTFLCPLHTIYVAFLSKR